MEHEEQIELKIWEYLDGLLTEQEKSAVERLIAENAEWRMKYQELMEVHQSIGLLELDQPSMRFTRNVMEEIAQVHIAPAAKEYINKKIVWGIGASFIAVILGMIVYGFAQVNWSTGSTDQSGMIDFTQVDYSALYNNSYSLYFMMASIVLGLMLFDKYLSLKKKQWQ